MINDRTKSILLQVAFKEAAEKSETTDEVESLTGDYYNILVGMHDKLGLSPDTETNKSRGSSRTKAPDRERSVTDDAPRITVDGVEYFDYRGLKELGAIENPKHPDFKTVDKKKSFWLTTQDGEPTQFAIDNDLA
jgi:hypothetical protein